MRNISYSRGDWATLGIDSEENLEKYLDKHLKSNSKTMGENPYEHPILSWTSPRFPIDPLSVCRVPDCMLLSANKSLLLTLLTTDKHYTFATFTLLFQKGTAIAAYIMAGSSVANPSHISRAKKNIRPCNTGEFCHRSQYKQK